MDNVLVALFAYEIGTVALKRDAIDQEIDIMVLV